MADKKKPSLTNPGRMVSDAAKKRSPHAASARIRQQTVKKASAAAAERRQAVVRSTRTQTEEARLRRVEEKNRANSMPASGSRLPESRRVSTNRPTTAPNSAAGTRPAKGGAVRMLRQRDVKWVQAAKNAKGKVIQKGRLVYRSGPLRDQPVSGEVRIEKPGSTYPSRTLGYRREGGGRNQMGNISVAQYYKGRNINAPGETVGREPKNPQQADMMRAKRRAAQRAVKYKKPARTKGIQAKGRKAMG